MSRAVGIDLGTTNSLVAYVDDGSPIVIRDADGDALLPSVVSIDPAGAVFVGREAQARLVTDPGRSIYSVKRFMGRGSDDVANEAVLLPFRLTGDPGGVLRIALGDRELTPPEISASILRRLKDRAEAYFTASGDADPRVDRAVITVPAYFNDAQRTATRDAGRLAGLEVLRIINEPTAAALAYGLDRREAATIAIYDFGGGTFDISILRIEDGVFQVLATNGDTHLGGDDIDQLLMGLVIKAVSLRGEPLTGEFVQRVRQAAIAAKWSLSTHAETTIEAGAHSHRLSRDEFDRAIKPLIERTLASCRQALADAGLAADAIDEVVLVGGSTRIPLVRRMVAEFFGREPHVELNPDEVVALGAAVQADNLVSGSRDMLLLDVTPLSLGIETMGGLTSRLIVRNSTIPATGTEVFTTGVDNQTAVDIHVVQGERELIADNRSLARFRLRGIPPMPAGMARVQVTFQIDADGILSVTAAELRTGVQQSIEVRPSYGLTEDEVEQMLIDSFENAGRDVATRQLIDARSEAERVVAATLKFRGEPGFDDVAGAELTVDEVAAIDAAVEGVRSVLSGLDIARIQEATRVLNDATRHLAEVMMNRSLQAALAGRNVDDIAG